MVQWQDSQAPSILLPCYTQRVASASGRRTAAGGQPSHPHFGQKEGGRGRRDLPTLTPAQQGYLTRVTALWPLLIMKKLGWEVLSAGSNRELSQEEEGKGGYWDG